MNFVDALVIVLLLAAAWSGFRRGLINSSIALVGAVGGAIIGVRVAPLLMDHVQDSAAKVAVGIAVVIVGVGIGEIAGATVGRALSERLTWRPARTLDRGLGLIGNTIAVLIVTWMIAIPLASTPYPWMASAMRSSSVLGAVDEVMPDSVRDVSTRMRQLFDDSGFPAILDPLTPTPDVQVSAPDPTLGTSAALAEIRTVGAQGARRGAVVLATDRGIRLCHRPGQVDHQRPRRGRHQSTRRPAGRLRACRPPWSCTTRTATSPFSTCRG